MERYIFLGKFCSIEFSKIAQNSALWTFFNTSECKTPTNTVNICSFQIALKQRMQNVLYK